MYCQGNIAIEQFDVTENYAKTLHASIKEVPSSMIYKVRYCRYEREDRDFFPVKAATLRRSCASRIY